MKKTQTGIAPIVIVIIIVAIIAIVAGTYTLVSSNASKSVPTDQSNKIDEAVIPNENNITEPQTNTPAINIASCEYIIEKTFRSVKAQETGMTQSGTSSQGLWRLTFYNANKFSWAHSDISESGTYTCANGAIIGNAYNIQYSGIFNSKDQTLLWEGATYKVE